MVLSNDPFAEIEKRELLDWRAMVQEAAGVLAMQDVLVREGVVRAGPRCWVTVTRVRFADSPATDSFGLLPVFRFVISSDADRRELHSFAIDSEVAIGALHHAHPAFERSRVPAPAFKLEPPVAGEISSDGKVRRGAERFLMISMVTLEDPPPRVAGRPPGVGIRFALSDGPPSAPPQLHHELAVGFRAARGRVGGDRQIAEPADDSGVACRRGVARNRSIRKVGDGQPDRATDPISRSRAKCSGGQGTDQEQGGEPGWNKCDRARPPGSRPRDSPTYTSRRGDWQEMGQRGSPTQGRGLVAPRWFRS